VWDSRTISLSVQDNGVGMAGSGSLHRRGVGVLSMRTRIRQLGGELDVVGGSSGTTVTATLPIKPNVFGQEVTLELLYQRSHSFMYVLTGSELRFTFANPAFLRMIDEQDVLGRRFVDVLPSLEQQFRNTIAQILESREAFVASSVPRVVIKNGVSRTFFLDVVVQPIFADDGSLHAIFVEGYDVTEKVATEERLRLVAQELDHRTNNLLSLVLGVVKLSEGDSAATLKQNIIGRLSALGNAHRLLSKSRGHGAALQHLVEEEMLPYTFGDPARVRLSGPSINLGPDEALGACDGAPRARNECGEIRCAQHTGGVGRSNLGTGRHWRATRELARARRPDG
jgi:PAS domain S-box-containing protein